tara:strand:- start:978 stop:1745 length:768 start_codon:yes stop_codon:yes gene_type:complete
MVSLLRISPLLLFLVGSVFHTGCVGVTEDEVQLSVEYTHSNGTIVEEFVDGELVSRVVVTIDFDFTKTEATAPFEFGIWGIEEPLSQNQNGNVISVDFSEHGIWDLTAFARTENGVMATEEIVIRVELQIEWEEESTYDPKPLAINSVSEFSGVPASSILIHSKIENPVLIENIGGGREVEVSWALIDEIGIVCQSQKGYVDEGEEVVWHTVHFGTYEVHELHIEYEEGQDYIDVSQTVTVQYPETYETKPNATQ